MENASPTLLIVEDDEDTREAVVTLLGQEGVVAASTEDAAHALEYLREHHVAAVFLDLGLPDMDGFDLMDVLRRDPALKDVPIVIMTASMTAKIPEGVPVLVKPFDVGALVELAREYCGRPA